MVAMVAAVFNVKLQMKFRVKTFYWLLELLYATFDLNANKNKVCLLKIFAYPSKVKYTTKKKKKNPEKQAHNLRNESLKPCIWKW